MISFRHAIVRQAVLSGAAVVPGASHGLPLEKPHLVNQLILDFLDAPTDDEPTR